MQPNLHNAALLRLLGQGGGHSPQHVGVPASLNAQQRNALKSAVGRSPGQNAGLMQQLSLTPHQSANVSHGLNATPHNQQSILSALWLNQMDSPDTPHNPIDQVIGGGMTDQSRIVEMVRALSGVSNG